MQMAKGETVAALYTKLGLDISSLDEDFALAGRTVNQAMGQLNHQTKKIKLETDIDIKKLDEAKDKTKILELQEQSLSKQMDIQRQKVELTSAAYRDMVAAKGADSAASNKLETRLLSERRAYSSLEAQMRKTQQAQSQSAAGGLVSSIRNKAIAGQALLPGMAGGALGMLGMAASPAGLAVGAAAAGTYAITRMIESAMSAGNSVYTLAQKMHTTNQEAARMSMMFKLAGSDANEAVPAIVRLDKSVQSAGEAGNDTTRMLQVFGVNLKDQSGNLLPVNDQLKALAVGYRNASAAGMENEYVSQVLGARGAALVPVLEQMTDLETQMSDVVTTGLLNPDDSHQLFVEWNKLKIESGQLGNAIGAALLPVAKEVMPELVDATKVLVQTINDHKESIRDIVNIFVGIAKAGAMASDKILGVADALKQVQSKGDSGSMWDKLASWGADAVKSMPMFAPFVAFSNLGGGVKTTPAATSNNSGSSQTSGDNAPESAPTKSSDQIHAELKALEDQKKLQQEQEAAAKKAAAANKEVEEQIYQATHSTLQNQLHDIDLKAEKYREEGADEVEVTRMAEAEKAKIMRDFNDNVLAQINRTWKSELQNRLDDIDREKRAWIQKGVDEVTATRWAEHEKSKARQNEALSMLRENREYLNIMRNAMAGEGSMQEKMNNARSGILMAMRRKMGIENDFTNPNELSMFSQIMNDVQPNLVPGLETSQWAQSLMQNVIPVYRGNQMTREVPGTQVNVTVSSGVVTYKGFVQDVTDAAVNKIVPAVRDVQRSQSVSYDAGA